MAKQLNRRRFLGYLVAAPTLTVAVGWTADLVHPQQARAAVPSLPQPERAARAAAAARREPSQLPH